jgi:hypothetical protein
MTTEQKNKIREVVKDVMSGMVENLVDETTVGGTYLCDRIYDSLPDEFDEDTLDEIDTIFGNDSGEVSEDIIESMVEELTNKFMEKFD